VSRAVPIASLAFSMVVALQAWLRLSVDVSLRLRSRRPDIFTEYSHRCRPLGQGADSKQVSEHE
jgi:hypothetical protein